MPERGRMVGTTGSATSRRGRGLRGLGTGFRCGRGRGAGLGLGLGLGLALASAGAVADDTAGTIRDGVYTAAQAERGAFAYPVACGKCHGYLLDGAPDDPDMFSTPPIGGPKFLRNWNGRSLAALFEYTRSSMPANNPGFLPEQELADVLAYLLQQSGAPAGDAELGPVPAELGRILIESGS